MPPSKKKPPAACASCTVARGERICITEKGQAGSGCPTLTRNDTVARANQEYAKGPVREFARQASIQEAEEAMCNPVLQARVLNEEATDLNVLLGLCVGHDSLFFRYAEAPTTVLAAKDRVTGHNPLAAVYLSESYYTRVRHPGL
ncbi:MAG: DUF1847 domain-containing protein [Desulfobacteraceae bacterium]